MIISRTPFRISFFGGGTDYCLFLIARYREELESGDANRAALTRSVRRVGGALAASAATVMVGLGLMGFAEFGKIRSAGPVIALGLAVTLAASLTLTPALLRLAGRAAFWPRRVRTAPKASGVWEYLSRLVVKRPLTVWGVALLLLLPFMGLGLSVRPTFKPTGDLSEGLSEFGSPVQSRHSCRQHALHLGSTRSKCRLAIGFGRN